MNKFLSHIILLLTFTSCVNFTKNNLYNEMLKHNIEIVMLYNSQEIDEYPLWSPNSNYIAINIEGTWKKIDLSKIASLYKVNWYNNKIGVLQNINIYPLTKEEEVEFKNFTKNNTRELMVDNNTKVELKLEGLSTSLIIMHNNKKEIIWSTNIENCHSLSLSPNKKYVAYICETNGLFLIKI